MKAFVPQLLLVIVMLISNATQAQFDYQNYANFREEVTGINFQELESYFPRPSAEYYKGYNNTPDLSSVFYLDSIKSNLNLTADEQSLLEQNHFFVTERLAYPTFNSALTYIYNNDLPVFISSDVVLHALHTSYDMILKNLEMVLMSENLKNYLKTLYDSSLILRSQYQNKGLDDCLFDIDIYTAVAYSLITGEEHLPQYHSRDFYDELMKSIDDEQYSSIPLFTSGRSRGIDFSQFTVRGHYVYTEEDEMMGMPTLEPYFRAMMWLGRTEFLLTIPEESPSEEPWTKDEIRRMNIDAFLLNQLNNSNEYLGSFQQNDEIIHFLIGESDNLTPMEYESYVNSLAINSADQLLDDSVYDPYYEGLSKNPEFEQKILSSILFSNNKADKPTTIPISYYLSGQRFIIDSYVFSNVVYDKTRLKRMMPNPLDVLYALGNSDAGYLLEDEIENYQYASNLAEMRYLIDNKKDEFWSESLYNTWLNSLRKLNPMPVDDNHPYFMNTAAWHHQKMNTQLASWSQLRHDNLLYAKQSYTAVAGCSFPYIYVEPVPEFYATLKEFSVNAEKFFSGINMGDYYTGSILNYYESFSEIMNNLQVVAEKELNGTSLSDDEISWLQSFLVKNDDGMCGAPPYTGWFYQLFLDRDKASEEDYLIADVHTQPSDESGGLVGKVLHVGVGAVDLGVIMIKNTDKESYVAYCAPFMSYYENISENFKRYTDQEWEDLIEANQQPNRPEWTHNYLASDTGEKLSVSVELPYTYYVGKDEPLDGRMSVVLYPNPVNDIMNIHLGENQNLKGFKLYNSQGQLMKVSKHPNVRSINFSAMKKGLYLLQISVDSQIGTYKILKN